MTDVSHELGALRFVVDSPLSSKVAMFNNQATQHKQSQLLNPFSHDGRATSPKPTFSKDQYGKPLAGSLTEMRGQKANMHVMKEMLELCQIIDSEGYQVKDEPSMRVIPFGELFNIYNYISDKVVGILLRARKHKLLEFEGEMLYQRRDDDVPIFLLRPIKQIRQELNEKIEDIKRGASPAPQSTSVLLDKSAHEQKLKVAANERQSKSRTPSPAVKAKAKSKSPSPSAAAKPTEQEAATSPAAVAPTVVEEPKAATTVEEPKAATTVEQPAAAVIIEQPTSLPAVEITPVPAESTEQVEPASAVESASEVPAPTQAVEATAEVPAPVAPAEVEAAPVVVEATTEDTASQAAAAPVDAPIVVDDLPTIIVEASATFVRTVSVDKLETPIETEAAESA
ncbi:probable serine/threonine-protein kinase kinX isoform X1 [Drosophila sulfurigaster albostrigata]|uniref:probable serine/threonine-protein kinase kinX isoform X1 n=2 Tax=Drosophila sulfurigaster albostrigata TaxID=89887 RepID=UPI002D21AC9D|nr:probable serine/threonine-protein kinase kinX isoform X1 [Drosophila sulfurigaster albostrigata]